MRNWQTIRSIVLIGAVAAVAAPAHAVLAQKLVNAHWGWVVARNSTTGSYTPGPTDRGNSSGGVNTIERTSAGNYVVHMPGLAASSTALGIAHVTTMGNPSRNCIVGEWDSVGTEETVFVRCYALNGTPADFELLGELLPGVRGLGTHRVRVGGGSQLPRAVHAQLQLQRQFEGRSRDRQPRRDRPLHRDHAEPGCGRRKRTGQRCLFPGHVPGHQLAGIWR